ncbi:YjfB family protein [Oceanobacillus salinisoli]|uniref:YjfB family protein n=1 Tax=Oceanobacillus salinisoli TaxID=2678611 RepID=UPI0012E24992|nr:YjfB family protein [Oceanobacillus salinisoli]
MDIAALSVVMAQNQVKSNVGISLMDKVMNMSEQQSNDLTKMLGDSGVTPPHPTLGKQLDIHV